MVPLLSAEAYAVQQVPSFLPSEQPCRLAESLALTHICSFLLPDRYIERIISCFPLSFKEEFWKSFKLRRNSSAIPKTPHSRMIPKTLPFALFDGAVEVERCPLYRTLGVNLSPQVLRFALTPSVLISAHEERWNASNLKSIQLRSHCLSRFVQSHSI